MYLGGYCHACSAGLHDLGCNTYLRHLFQQNVCVLGWSSPFSEAQLVLSSLLWQVSNFNQDSMRYISCAMSFPQIPWLGVGSSYFDPGRDLKISLKGSVTIHIAWLCPRKACVRSRLYNVVKDFGDANANHKMYISLLPGGMLCWSKTYCSQ